MIPECEPLRLAENRLSKDQPGRANSQPRQTPDSDAGRVAARSPPTVTHAREHAFSAQEQGAVWAALASEGPPKYERKPAGSAVVTPPLEAAACAGARANGLLGSCDSGLSPQGTRSRIFGGFRRPSQPVL